MVRIHRRELAREATWQRQAPASRSSSAQSAGCRPPSHAKQQPDLHPITTNFDSRGWRVCPRGSVLGGPRGRDPAAGCPHDPLPECQYGRCGPPAYRCRSVGGPVPGDEPARLDQFGPLQWQWAIGGQPDPPQHCRLDQRTVRPERNAAASCGMNGLAHVIAQMCGPNPNRRGGPCKEAYLPKLPAKSPRPLLVSLADKAHNAEAILVDYRTLGDSLWDRFNGGADGTRWYYGAPCRRFPEDAAGAAL